MIRNTNIVGGSEKCTSSSRIALLGPEAYLTELEVIRENPTSLVHVAEIACPIHGRIQAFVKTFPTKFVETALANELAAYLLACAAQLVVADQAYILILRTEQLFKVHPTFKLELVNEHGLSYAWVTKAIDGPPLRLLHQIDEPELQKRLRKWPLLPRVLAFDDLVANEDRSHDNLIAIQNGKFALVDHAEIAGGVARIDEFLDPTISSKNQLLSMLYGNTVPQIVSSGMMLAAESHVEIFQQIEPELKYWYDKLFPDSEARGHALLSFLNKRAQNSVLRIRQQQGLLL
ncbi:MAG: hypothetical protein J0I94_08610 [Thiobacillus sp.]|nr:hypothetical protein [Thiobacillus sp.]